MEAHRLRNFFFLIIVNNRLNLAVIELHILFLKVYRYIQIRNPEYQGPFHSNLSSGNFLYIEAECVGRYYPKTKSPPAQPFWKIPKCIGREHLKGMKFQSLITL